MASYLLRKGDRAWAGPTGALEYITFRGGRSSSSPARDRAEAGWLKLLTTPDAAQPQQLSAEARSIG